MHRRLVARQVPSRRESHVAIGAPKRQRVIELVRAQTVARDELLRALRAGGNVEEPRLHARARDHDAKKWELLSFLPVASKRRYSAVTARHP